MKIGKRLKNYSIIVICLFILCSCGNDTSSNDSNATIDSLKQEIEELKAQIKDSEKESTDSQSNDESKNMVNNNTSLDSDDEMPVFILKLNESTSISDIMDVTITGAEWCDSIMPDDTSGFYSYYDDEKNETYFVVHGTITSHANDSFDIRWCSDSSILINRQYNFASTMEFEDSDGTGFGEEIKPLQTRKFIIYSSVSDEVCDISDSIIVNFRLPDNEEELGYFYDENNSNVSCGITFSDIKH